MIMNHVSEDVLKETDEFITEIEMDIEERKLEEAAAEDDLMLLKKILSLI